MLNKKQKGFTLIELLVVVAILGILAAVAVPNLAKFVKHGEIEAAKTELSIVQTALTAYMVENPPIEDGEFDISGIAPYLLKGVDGLGWEYTITFTGGSPDIEQGAKK